MPEFFGALATTLVVFLAPFLLLRLEGVKTAKRARLELSLPSEWKPRRTITLAASMFTQILLALFALGFALYFLGALDSWRIVQLIREQSLSVLLLAVFFAPIAEELFFRGYLQKKTGVVLSSLLFAGLHYGYGSVSEIAGAFLASIILGYGMLKFNDLRACVLAHACYNALSIWVAFAL